MDELEEQSKKVLNKQKVDSKNFTKQIAFNVIPHIDTFMEDVDKPEEPEEQPEDIAQPEVDLQPIAGIDVNIPKPNNTAYTADALRRSIRLLLSKENVTSSVGSSIDFSGGATITLGSAKKYFVLLLFPSRIVK